MQRRNVFFHRSRSNREDSHSATLFNIVALQPLPNVASVIVADAERTRIAICSFKFGTFPHPIKYDADTTLSLPLSLSPTQTNA